jgi:hypothetical protein
VVARGDSVLHIVAQPLPPERWRFGWMRLPGVCTRGCTQRDI